jgi:hypothetical protein
MQKKQSVNTAAFSLIQIPQRMDELLTHAHFNLIAQKVIYINLSGFFLQGCINHPCKKPIKFLRQTRN